MVQPEKGSVTTNYKWFGLSLQALVLLSRREDWSTSSDIAARLNSEASLIRRILAKLSKAQLIETREGRVGGYRMKGDPAAVTLADVYQALGMKEPVCSGMQYGTEEMSDVLSQVSDEVERRMLDTLEKVNIEQLYEKCQGNHAVEKTIRNGGGK